MSTETQVEMKQYTLYNDFPASEWELCTPIGNGYTGAMIYGTVDEERIQLSEEHIWSGNHINTDFPEFREIIEHTRSLLLDGKAAEADEYTEKALNGRFHRIASYETAGDLFLRFHDDSSCDSYSRDLDLNCGVSDITYKKGDITYSRTSFASYPDKLIAFRFEADRDHSISFDARYERNNAAPTPNGGQSCRDKNTDEGLPLTSRKYDDNTLYITGSTATGGHEFNVIIRFVIDNGSLCLSDTEAHVSGADSCCIYISIEIEKDAVLPEKPDWDELFARHTDDFSSLMERSDIVLGKEDEELESKPVAERLRLLRNDINHVDGGLVALYFQFGKYLLVSSSRPGTLPANLQGVWNTYLNAPWNSDYHTNINLQMNYWHAEVANISECAEPLFDYINNYLLEGGRRVAEVNYHCRGAVLHHLSDLYGFAAPADGLWGLWPLGGAWLCYHLWEHYLYNCDTEYLRGTAYTYIKECTRFFLDYMFEDDKGRLLSGPSTSPENRYFCNGRTAYLCLSPTMDIEIVSGLFSFFIKASEILGIDSDMADEAKAALAKMPPLKIGKYGQLMEWLEDYDEPEPGHRHISHMFGVYPGCSVTKSDPDLFNAAKKTLERRLSNGGGHTGWSAAWLISLHARLLDSRGVYDMIRKLLCNSTRDNLFDSHPPFQIDGNFGGASGIAEMLIQSHEDEIVLLPALPEQFAEGHFSGLKARGGITVDYCFWENGKVTSARISIPEGKNCRVVINGNVIDNCTGCFNYKN